MLSGTSCEWCSGLKGGGWGPLSRLLEGSSRSEFLFSLNLQGRGGVVRCASAQAQGWELYGEGFRWVKLLSPLLSGFLGFWKPS